jgi:hypothetical protein
VNLFWFCLSSYGITQIIVYGKIFDKVRPSEGFFGKLLNCTMCTGFWVGLFLWYLSSYTQLINFDSSYVTAFLCASASSAASYVLNTVFDDNGIKVEKIIHISKELK